MTAALTLPSYALSAAQQLELVQVLMGSLRCAEQMILDATAGAAQPDPAATRASLEQLGLIRQFGQGAQAFVVPDLDAYLTGWQVYAERMVALTGSTL